MYAKTRVDKVSASGCTRPCFDRLAELGYFQAFAGIALPNAASEALHEGVGFEPIGVYRKVGFKFGSWHDVGWWQRPLRVPDLPTSPPLAFDRLR